MLVSGKAGLLGGKGEGGVDGWTDRVGRLAGLGDGKVRDEGWRICGWGLTLRRSWLVGLGGEGC